MNITKTLTEMTREVDAYCQEKGWRKNPVSFGEAMALLHSEVSEALEAWRDWGLADATGSVWADIDNPQNRHLPKPEGVGSEFADILIRLLDDSAIFGVDLADEIARWNGGFGIYDTFGENMNQLHVMIAGASKEVLIDGRSLGHDFACIYRLLTELSEHYGINLFAEYERKMAYNRTRAYKHGGRTI